MRNLWNINNRLRNSEIIMKVCVLHNFIIASCMYNLLHFLNCHMGQIFIIRSIFFVTLKRMLLISINANSSSSDESNHQSIRSLTFYHCDKYYAVTIENVTFSRKNVPNIHKSVILLNTIWILVTLCKFNVFGYQFLIKFGRKRFWYSLQFYFYFLSI